MSTQVQIRRGNTAQTSVFTGAVAEITIDTDKKTLVVHDGTNSGGFALARESALSSNSVFSQASFNTANAAFIAANTPSHVANSASIYANGAFTAANAATSTNTTQNNNITVALNTANGAFAQANTDYTTISISTGTYGNTAYHPVITVAANGRITAVSNSDTQLATIPDVLALSIALG
jgi:hypothetical protein